MKSLATLFLIILCMACNEVKQPPNSEKQIEKITDFDWLIGDWQRVNEKEGKETFEQWKKKSDSEYIGMGFTLQNQDTIWKENIRLIYEHSIWSFQVTGANEKTPTVFTLTEFNSNSFVCESPENEFPKKIKYLFEDDKIKAVISGGGPVIPFEFERSKSN